MSSMTVDREPSRSTELLFTISYVFLFAAAASAIAPYAYGLGPIWIAPKLASLAALDCILLIHLVFVIKARGSAGFTFTALKRVAPLVGFLILGLIAGLMADPERAFTGHPDYGDGASYWLLITGLFVLNYLLLSAEPRWQRAQVWGVLLGATVNAIAVAIQQLDWTVDFTVTSGQVEPATPNQLFSSIFSQQMPIGLTRHRGIVGISLAFGAIATFLLHGRGRRHEAPLAVLFICLTGLWLTATRAPIAVGALSVVLLAVVSWRTHGWNRRVSTVGLAFAASIIAATLLSVAGNHSRPLPSLDAGVNAFTSGRVDLWRVGLMGVQDSPFGLGFDGFVQAYIRETVNEEELQSVANRSLYTFTLTDGTNTARYALPTAKAHNVVLDAGLSAGVAGAVLYIFAHLTALRALVRSRLWTALAIPLSFLAYGLFWYDVVGVTHVVWWAYSLAGAVAVPSIGTRDTKPTPRV
jgi:O-antigen ligase